MKSYMLIIIISYSVKQICADSIDFNISLTESVVNRIMLTDDFGVKE